MVSQFEERDGLANLRPPATPLEIWPEAPRSIADTGLSSTFLEDLALKTLSSAGALTLAEAAVRQALMRAFFAGRPALLYGNTGNGKTSILDAYGASIGQSILIPHALYT